MRVHLTCKRCQHSWTSADEPRQLIGLTCPSCAAAAPPRAAEDLASALEDALCQLWLVSQAVGAHITLDTDAIPPAFRPLDT